MSGSLTATAPLGRCQRQDGQARPCATARPESLSLLGCWDRRACQDSSKWTWDEAGANQVVRRLPALRVRESPQWRNGLEAARLRWKAVRGPGIGNAVKWPKPTPHAVGAW